MKQKPSGIGHDCSHLALEDYLVKKRVSRDNYAIWLKRISSFLFHWVLRGHYQKWRLELEGFVANSNLA
jgi:hypothetical protein